jgi:hypothetical protein
MRSTITKGRFSFRVTTERDDDNTTPPWETEDGHGPVSGWLPRYNPHTGCRDKEPGQVILASDGGGARGRVRYYDWVGATRMAKAEGWGISPEVRAAFVASRGREPTAKEIAREAVQQDFDRLKGWCEGRWEYVGVVVVLLDSDGEETDIKDCLFGIESDCVDYIEEQAEELASGLLEQAREHFAEEMQRDAAPDLLKACRAALVYLGDAATDDSPEAAEVRATIANAIAAAGG